MQEKLIIFLHTTITDRVWWVMVAGADIVQTGLPGNPLDLAALAQDKEVIVVVPAEEVGFLTVKLPVLSRAKLQAALPYALEEQLVADVTTLHFAPGSYSADGVLSVAVVTLEKMQRWMGLFQEWHIKPHICLPSSLALPVTQHAWHIVVGPLALVRLSNEQAFACDVKNLTTLLNSALTTTVEYPTCLYIHNYTEQPIAATLNVPIEVNETLLPRENIFSDLAQQVALQPAINLLQGTFATKRSRLPRMQKLWQYMTYLAAGWLLLLFLYPAVSYLLLKQRLHSVNQQMTAIYKEYFPDATSMVAPKLRMEEKIKTFNTDLGGNRFLLLTAYAGKALTQVAGIKLKRFEFQNDQLTLELSAASSDDVSTFSDVLMQQGANVKEQNATLNGERVNTTLVIQ